MRESHGVVKVATMGEAAFADVFAHAPLAMALVEPAPPFRIAAANAAFLGLGGRRVHDGARGIAVLELIPHAPESSLHAVLESVVTQHGSQTILDSWTARPGVQTHREITVTYASPPGAGDLPLITVRDVTEREESRRRLEQECMRLLALAGVGRQMVTLDPDAMLAGAAASASLLCDGPAVIYLVEPGGELRRAASHRVMTEMSSWLPLLPGRHLLRLLRKAIETRERLTVPYVASLPEDERALLTQSHAMWLVANPLRTRAGVLGAVLTVWRRRRTLPEDFQALDQVAAQTAVALEHAQLHTAAEKERARLDLILEEIPDTVWIVDANARLVRTNSAGRRLLGLAPDDPLPPLAELTPCLDGPDGEDRALDGGDLGLGTALRGKTVTGAVSSFRRREGDPERWLLASAAPLRDHDRRVIGAVGVSTDITERRRSEEMLRLLAAASNTLVASLDHRATLTAMAGLTVPSLGDWCVIDLLEDDQTVVRLPVAHADPSQRETASELRRLGPDPSTLAAALAGVQEPAIRDAPEAPLVTMLREEERTGMLRALRLRACMIVPLVARGRKVGLMQFAMSRPGRGYHPADLGVAEDLAHRAAMSIDNARLYQQACEADRRKDEFLAVLSHELRAPLAPVMTWIEILRRAPDPARVRHAVEVIDRNVRVQRALMNELLDLAAITRGKVALEPRSIDLVELVRACVDTLSGEAGAKTIRLQVRLPDGGLVVRGDPNRLHQVFANLIANAIKFTPEGGLVSVILERQGDAAVARVRDTGEGIEPAFLPQVFEMFKQQEEGARRVHGGLGIGLALAKRLTELHLGTIEVTSEGPGRGSEFIVCLPLLDETDETEIVTERGLFPSGAERGQPLRDLTVLLVEDADDLREATQAMLEELGARVVGAENGEEALERLRPEEVDVVLCDLRMPQMDGYEFVSLLRKDPERAHVPVVAVSGFASQESYQRSREAGFDGYVSKPFEYATLVASLQQAMAARQRAAESPGQRSSA